jgi:hypothetical protein
MLLFLYYYLINTLDSSLNFKDIKLLGINLQWVYSVFFPISNKKVRESQKQKVNKDKT